MRLLVGTLILVLASAAAAAQPVLRVERASQPPQLEDYSDGSPPAGAAAVNGFVQREPGDGVPSTQQTSAYVSYDDKNLYVVFVCEDTEPDRIRARLTRREDVGETTSSAWCWTRSTTSGVRTSSWPTRTAFSSTASSARARMTTTASTRCGGPTAG